MRSLIYKAVLYNCQLVGCATPICRIIGSSASSSGCIRRAERERVASLLALIVFPGGASASCPRAGLSEPCLKAITYRFNSPHAKPRAREREHARFMCILALARARDVCSRAMSEWRAAPGHICWPIWLPDVKALKAIAFAAGSAGPSRSRVRIRGCEGPRHPCYDAGASMLAGHGAASVLSGRPGLCLTPGPFA